MLDLSLYPKFQSDIQGNVTNVHPLIIIHSSPNKYYLSQNEDILTVNNEVINFKAVNLKVPSIKESLDLESRKIKINNVTITFSNYDDFSDKIFNEQFINKYVDIYWKSQSCNHINDCLLVYKAVIKRLDHDSNTIKLILEDKTESVIHKEVPIASIAPENAYSDKYVNKTIPMTYGSIKHAPSVLYKDSSLDSVDKKYIYVLSDRWEYSRLAQWIPHSADNYPSGTDTNHSLVSVFTGNYLYICPTYRDLGQGYPYNYNTQYDIEYYHIRFHQKFDGEFPQSPLAENVAQVVINRNAVSASLLDNDTATSQGYDINYMGETEGYYIENIKNLVNNYNIESYDGESLDSFSTTYANVPSMDYDADIEISNDGFMELSSFRTSSGEGSFYSTNHWSFDIANVSTNLNDMGERDERGEYNTIAYHIHALPCELITLPQPHILHLYYSFWYSVNYNTSPSLADSFVGGTHTMEYIDDAQGNKHRRFRIDMTSGSSYYILFSRTPDGEAIYDEPLESEPKNIQIWDLLQLNAGRIYGDSVLDIPRVRVESLEDVVTYPSNSIYIVDNTDYNSFDGETITDHRYIGNYNAYWNGVSTNIWGNSSIWGGDTNVHSDHIAPFTYWNIDALPEDGSYVLYYWLGSNGNEFSYNHMFSQNSNNWWIHFTESTEIFGRTVPKGWLMPTSHSHSYVTAMQGGGSSGGAYRWDWENDWLGSSYSLGGVLSTNPSYMTLSIGDSSFYNEQRVGIAYTLEDSGATDVQEESGVTQFWGKFSVYGDSEYETGNYNLKVNFIEAEMQDEDEATLYEQGAGELISWHQGYFDDNLWRTFNTEADSYPSGVFSSTWAEPERFNAAVLRFWLDGTDSTAQLPLQIKLYKLGVKHICNIGKLLNKDLYSYSTGRTTSLSKTNPVSVIEDIIKKELEIDPIRGDGFMETYDEVGSYKVMFSITKKMNSKKLIEDIAKNTTVIPYFKSTEIGSALNFTHIKSIYELSDVDETIKSKDVISYSFTRTKIEKIKTMCRVQYRKDYARNNYKKNTLYRDAYDLYGNGDLGYYNGYSKQYLGLDRDNPGDSVLEITSDYIRDTETANNLRDFIVAYNCNQHNILKIKLPLSYVHLEISDIINFDSLINNQKAYGENYTTSNTRNGQEIYPYFIVTSVNKSTNSISVECQQLHRLTPTNNIIAGSGDINRTGGDADQDDIDLLEDYMLGAANYFTEGQLKAADMDGNYILDEADLSILTNQVNQTESDTDTGDDIPEGTIEEIAAQFSLEPTSSLLRDLSATTWYCSGGNSYTGFFYIYPRDHSAYPGQYFTDSVYNLISPSDGEWLTGGFIRIGGTESDFTDAEFIEITYLSGLGATQYWVNVLRGALGTTRRAHSSGEEVQLYSTNPLISTNQGLTDTYLMYTYINNIVTDLGGTTIDLGNTTYPSNSNGYVTNTAFPSNWIISNTHLYLFYSRDEVENYDSYTDDQRLFDFRPLTDIMYAHGDTGGSIDGSTGNPFWSSSNIGNHPLGNGYLRIGNELFKLYHIQFYSHPADPEYIRFAFHRGSEGSLVTPHYFDEPVEFIQINP